ncbi:MAG: putative ABC transport system ATP-binding protein [Desulforhopalus sp.]|jgi:putative ABC transport system ATP-binding protein
MSAHIIQAKNISKHFTLGGQRIQILNDISLSVVVGEFVVVAGRSGSGKSTLLSVLSGLDKPDGGRVELCSVDITPLSEDQLAPIRNESIGFVFQSFHLIPSLSAIENIQFPAELKKDKMAKEKAQDLLDKVGLGHRAGNFPSQMSGGEQQRVAICRALINEPKIVFADEPTGNLDSENSEGIIELLYTLHAELNTTLVIATHSHSLAARAERIIRLRDGVIEEGRGM